MRFFAFVSTALAAMIVANAMSVDTQTRRTDVDGGQLLKINQLIDQILAALPTKDYVNGESGQDKGSEANELKLTRRFDLTQVGALITQIISTLKSAPIVGPVVDALTGLLTEVVGLLNGKPLESALGSVLGAVFGLVQELLVPVAGQVTGAANSAVAGVAPVAALPPAAGTPSNPTYPGMAGNAANGAPLNPAFVRRD
ncbi:hypothetical protein B0H14DRAFT_3859458 [Mycena olivaceomarginata]|nr:hypothetical protein B0H14DRAFT_3859458 [Mycena olivaceomarginata]